MDTTVTFVPDHTPSSQSGWGNEWAVATQTAEGDWVRGEVIPESAARREAEQSPGAVVISREVGGWRDSPVYEPFARYDGSMDELVAGIIDEENAVVRAGLLRGAEIAVTHMSSPGKRIAHRISCASLEEQFDRERAWHSRFRERLQEEPGFRPALATLMTRSEARTHVKLQSCKSCWPNIGGEESAPTSKLYAEGLKSHHIGRILADENGLEIGIVKKVILTRSAESAGRFDSDIVTVETENQTITLQPRERVQIRSIVDTPAVSAREAAVRSRVGVPAGG